MPRAAAIVAVAGTALLLAVMLAFGALGLAVREGVLDELVVWLPPRGRYQFILRVGADAPPWDRRGGRPTAINLWAHGRNTAWHMATLVHIPLGEPHTQPDRPAP